ncbi:hypothetical protein FRACYDRAFT_246615 [Fragilariopsis cylindrus CCMP1102]|uniref:PiggyBac transposable element-derived protein domain-containing protein n=1 Tax=Fragilariopsis cylindrus CCMP1102 TaxID=635003 RepID=A0A1E7EXR3_9STRA|nr:hypothetical protein FRACYDRAFT_246615 [Fragilariopsis cylindrus CCMP1102]|eukprot:OEU10751.1 hypothetical protein FRACYDRAFT_246615 [Fragilariopsis cylindrus CCMP1102]
MVSLYDSMLKAFKYKGHFAIIDSAYMGDVMSLVGQEYWGVNMVGTCQTDRVAPVPWRRLLHSKGILHLMVEKFKGMRIDEILESLARGTKPVTNRGSIPCNNNWGKNMLPRRGIDGKQIYSPPKMLTAGILLPNI